MTYPTSKISQIYSVFEDNHVGRSSTVVWRVPTPGTLVIDLVDLDRSVRWLSFAFEPTTAVLATPVDPETDITVANQTYYDTAGAAIAGTLSVEKDVR